MARYRHGRHSVYSNGKRYCYSYGRWRVCYDYRTGYSLHYDNARKEERHTQPYFRSRSRTAHPGPTHRPRKRNDYGRNPVPPRNPASGRYTSGRSFGGRGGFVFDPRNFIPVPYRRGYPKRRRAGYAGGYS